MCGISGVVGPSVSFSQGTLERMNRSLSHRGPDASGTKVFEGKTMACGLGHTRLSIIDLAGGLQPMPNEDGSVWVTYNGEIYNHGEIRPLLEARGHRYRTSSDTETIVHLYEEYGADCVHHLRGMFAFAVWDQRNNRLFAARDRLGIKPFYFALNDKTFVFGSEIKAILESGLVRPELDQKRLPEYFAFGYVTDEQTLFSGIEKLLPGHYLIYDESGIKTRPYWNVTFGEEDLRPFQEIVGQVGELFEKSVELRLMSDVPLGMFLSGGLDSSSIACTMARLTGERIQAFTVDFQKGYYSESRYAEQVAQSSNMDLHKVVVTADDFISTFEKLIWHNDLPIHFPASIALYFVSLEAVRHVKVVLTGEGSDEIFGGYGRYRASVLNLKMARLLGGAIPAAARRYFRKNAWSLPIPLKAKKGIAHSLLYHDRDPRGIIFDNYYGVFLPEEIRDLTNGNVCLNGSEAHRTYLKYFDTYPEASALKRMLYTDLKTYLEELLMKQDKMSMATSIESRVPFLDHKLVEFSATIADGMKIKGPDLKHVFKECCRTVVPREIINRPKMGFPIPLAAWMREAPFNPYLKEILFDDRTRQRGIFDSKYVERLVGEHERSLRDNSQKIWQLLNFELWCRTFLDRQPAGRPS